MRYIVTSPFRMALVLIPLLCLSCIPSVFALTDQQSRVPGYAGFEQYPEKFDFDGMPRTIPAGEIERITNRKIRVGMIINKKNVEGIKKELIALTSPGIYNMVKKGMELEIADYKPWPVPKIYGAVTKANRGRAVLSSDGNLKTTSGDWWTGGEPFFNLTESDRDAGIKAWYNQVHVYDGDDFTHDWVNMLFVGSKGKRERLVEMSWDRIFLTSREFLAPKPTYDSKMTDIFFKELVYVQTPPDLQGYGNLTYRYNDQNRLDDSFTYIPMMRRIRRVTSGQRFDAFVGSDSSIGDFRTLDVPVARWNWKLINVQPKLTTLFSTDFITENKAAQRHHPTTVGEKFPRMHWRLWPQVYVIEATPKTRNDCSLYSKKILWVLGGCWKSGLADAYDQQGRLWKTTQNYFYGYGDGRMLDLLSHYETDFYTYDHQRDHASPWFIDLPYRKFNVGFSAERFSTKYLQRYGH